MTYKPQPGTLPHRVIEYVSRLKPGSHIANSPLADELDTDPQTILQSMSTAVRHGAITKSRVDGRVVWSAGTGDHQEHVSEEEAEDEKKLQQKVVIVPALQVPPLSTPRPKIEIDLGPAPAPAPAPEPKRATPAARVDKSHQKPAFSLKSDGSLIIQQGQETLHLEPEHARRLRTFMADPWRLE